MSNDLEVKSEWDLLKIVFKCPFCDDKFKTRQTLFAHLQRMEKHNYTERFLLNHIISSIVDGTVDK